ncbi:MAG: hypothetical protein LBR56_03525 [Sporomusaceae bacterium]|nr:hypothetical protein [Sporomusaceae bacterium]
MVKNENALMISWMFLFKLFFMGFLFAEVFLLAKAAFIIFYEISVADQHDFWFWPIVACYYLTFVVTLGILCKNEVFTKISNLSISGWGVLLLGAVFLFLVDGLGIVFLEKCLHALSWAQLAVTIMFPPCVFLAYLRR